MHGMIFQQLQQFVNKNHGYETWPKVLAEAGLMGKTFLPNQIYPDADALAIVGSACRLLNVSAAEVLQAFGQYIAPNLLRIYAASIKPEWNVIDIIERTENTMHKAVRHGDKGATPPALICKRLSTDKVLIEYKSERKLIDLGIGIIKGFGKHFNEKLEIKRTDGPAGTILEIARA